MYYLDWSELEIVEQPDLVNSFLRYPSLPPSIISCPIQSNHLHQHLLDLTPLPSPYYPPKGAPASSTSVSFYSRWKSQWWLKASFSLSFIFSLHSAVGYRHESGCSFFPYFAYFFVNNIPNYKIFCLDKSYHPSN